MKLREYPSSTVYGTTNQASYDVINEVRLGKDTLVYAHEKRGDKRGVVVCGYTRETWWGLGPTKIKVLASIERETIKRGLLKKLDRKPEFFDFWE